MKPTVFVGSSTESKDVQDALVVNMSEYFGVRPWDTSIPPGRTVLDVLKEQLSSVHAAVLIFTQDDERNSRGEHAKVARDNVILEYGFFASHLGTERVWILREEGVAIPSDLLGLTTLPFRRDPSTLEAQLRDCVRKMRQEWGSTPRLSTGLHEEIFDATLGYRVTLQRQRQELAAIVTNLQLYEGEKKPRFPRPLLFDSSDAALWTHSEALDLVQHRFWATTFLSSEFWISNSPEIIEANAKMTERLRRSGGQARRLFLLDQPNAMVAEAYRQHRITQRLVQKDDELRRLARQFDSLKRNFRRIINEGFEVRVVYDANQRFQSLGKMLPDPSDSELAIYDDFRVDVFGGGRIGTIRGAHSYSGLIRNFPGYLRAAEQYFQDLWEDAGPMESFLEQLQEAVDSAQAKIDYTTNWIAKCEFNLDQEDKDLRTAEHKRVEEVLRDQGRWGKVRRYLDVGTCTGRYLIDLREAVAPDGDIIGMDEDNDCVRVAGNNVKLHCPDDARIRIVERGFGAMELMPEGPFDLITCMLGRLSHFCWDRPQITTKPFDDLLQRILERMSALLSDDGLLFLGTWSSSARRNRHMLKIYTDIDQQRLAEWTPDAYELRERLTQAGLQVVMQFEPDTRLDLVVCQRE